MLFPVNSKLVADFIFLFLAYSLVGCYQHNFSAAHGMDTVVTLNEVILSVDIRMFICVIFFSLVCGLSSQVVSNYFYFSATSSTYNCVV